MKISLRESKNGHEVIFYDSSVDMSGCRKEVTLFF